MDTSRVTELRKKSVYREIPADKIGVDHRYQAPLNTDRVRRIRFNRDGTSALDVGALGTLEISERADGTYWVIDGQHRRQAVFEECADFPMDCIVHTGLTLAQEAQLFEYFNSSQHRRNPSALIDFKAALVAENPEAVRLLRTLNACGLDVAYNNDTSKDRTLTCVAALYYIANLGGHYELNLVLTILVDAWNGDRASLTGTMVKGMHRFIRRYQGQYDRKTLVQKLQGETPSALGSRANNRAKLLGGDVVLNMAVAIKEAYNRHLRLNKLPDWNDSRGNLPTPHSSKTKIKTRTDDVYINGAANADAESGDPSAAI